MNDIERLIAGLSRPSPSSELDARIHRVLHDAMPVAAPKRPRPLLRWSVLAGTAACAGMVGFVLGRQSAQAHSDAQSDVVAAAPNSESSPGETHSTTVIAAVNREALERFVMPNKPYESLFGSRPLEEQDASVSFE